jgi:hypothetical protein
MRTQAEIDAILTEVRARLDTKRRATGVDLRVPQDGYLQNDDWLNVIVTPTAQGMRAYEYVDALSDLEKELRDNGIEHVLLVPALAD